MIFGVGIDLCDAGRLEKSLAKQSFLDHVFAPSEQALLASLGEKRRAETAAANFAAKEAFLKAAGTGLGGFAGHSHKYHKRGKSGYMFRLATVQDFSAVTAACLLVRAAVYDDVDGLDENYAVAFNDVDFCLRVRDAGWRIIWSPYAELYHYESKSRGMDEKDKAKKARFTTEQQRLEERFTRYGLTHDPYYNPSLTLDREDFWRATTCAICRKRRCDKKSFIELRMRKSSHLRCFFAGV